MNDWITDSQDELSFDELIRDVDQIHIPIFQRSYVWKKREFDYVTIKNREETIGIKIILFQLF